MSYFSSLLHEGLKRFDSSITGISREITAKEQSHNYTDRFINAKELLNKNNTGFSPDGTNWLPIKTANFLCCGNSGVGKSSIVSAMSLWRRTESFVVTDPSGELYELLAFILLKAGYKVKVINWSKPDISCGYNSLGHIKSVKEIHTQAHQIVQASLGKGTGDAFWSFQSESLITFFAEVLYYNGDPQYFNWVNVLHLIELLTANPSFVDQLVINTNSQQLINRYKNILALDNKLKMNIVASSLSCLTIFNDPNVQRICSYDTLDFSNMRAEPTVIFIQSDVLNMSYYSTLNSMLITDIISSLMSELPKSSDKYRVLFVLDEFSSLSINNIDTIISNVRKYHISLGILIQSYSQLYSRYGEHIAKTIINNCAARMYFHSQTDATTLHNLEQELGRYSYTIDGKTMNRELKTMSEIRKMDAGKAILLYTNFDPVLLSLKPYYDQPLVMHELNKPVPELFDELPDEIPLIGM
ncbi:MAG TPA: type IV secretory system conjugative DNA transfer family protein [Chitinophagales bacterium]|jgi:type IV secretion system protein VirD4|nr:type IV secretory system conjugative DNA transfer family protein [Chitinophagales bacterium]